MAVPGLCLVSAFTKLAVVESTQGVALAPAMKLPPPKPPTTDWNNTLRDIYLDYRTSPELDMGTAESLSATTIYAAGALVAAAGVGTVIGNGMNYLIQTYDPSPGDAIGGTIAGMLNAASQSYDDLPMGQYQSSFDNLFGLPISDSTNPDGPDGLTDPMVMYYQTYGFPSGYGGGGDGSGVCDD